jgi:hypothetical protein
MNNFGQIRVWIGLDYALSGGGKICSYGAILALDGHTNPPVTYCIATCDVP